MKFFAILLVSFLAVICYSTALPTSDYLENELQKREAIEGSETELSRSRRGIHDVVKDDGEEIDYLINALRERSFIDGIWMISQGLYHIGLRFPSILNKNLINFVNTLHDVIDYIIYVHRQITNKIFDFLGIQYQKVKSVKGTLNNVKEIRKGSKTKTRKTKIVESVENHTF